MFLSLTFIRNNNNNNYNRITVSREKPFTICCHKRSISVMYIYTTFIQRFPLLWLYNTGMETCSRLCILQLWLIENSACAHSAQVQFVFAQWALYIMQYSVFERSDVNVSVKRCITLHRQAIYATAGDMLERKCRDLRFSTSVMQEGLNAPSRRTFMQKH